MKRWLALLLTVVLVCMSCTALAAEASYAPTKDFLAALDEEDIKYFYKGIDKDDDEVVSIENTSSVYGDATFYFYFDEDEVNLTARVWNVITFDEADRDAVIEACNKLNADYRFTRFYVAEDDNSVTMAYDAYLSKRSPGDICVNIVYAMHNILEAGWPELKGLDK